MIKYYDIHYFEDLANLEYCMDTDDIKRIVNSNLLYLSGPDICEYELRSFVDDDFKMQTEPVTHLTDLGLSKVREILTIKGYLPLHERGLSFTEMVNIYNMRNPNCIRDIGEKWKELYEIEDEKERFLRYRDLSERELNDWRIRMTFRG